MLAVEGIYQDSQLILNQKVSFSKPVKVIVTFLEDPNQIDISQFSFARSKEALKEVKGSLSDVVIEERELSLVSAMRGMEEEEPLYTRADIKVQFL